MSTTVKIYPTTTAHQYWRDTTWTQNSPYTRAYAGITSYRYHWPIPFDLSAYAGKQLVSMKLCAKFSSESNGFAGDERVRAGYTTSNANEAAAHAATLLAEVFPTDNTFCEFNIANAWSTLIAGTTYLVISSDAPGDYAVFYTNYGTVAAADRPYIELVYNEPIQVNIDGGTTWKYATALQVNVTGGANDFKPVTKLQVFDGANWKTAF